MDPPTQPENIEQQLTFTHPRIGQRKFACTGQQSLAEYRAGLQLSSQLYLFTNYHFEYKGVRVSDLEPIGSLTQEREIRIEVVFGVFDYKSAQFHVARAMECLFNPEYYLFLCKAERVADGEHRLMDQLPKGATGLDIENLKPDLTSPFLLASTEVEKKATLLTSFSLSGFNPAPISERLNGDLFYLHARTLEGQDIHITASPAGFFVNQSKISSFNPSRSPTYKSTYGSLIDLFKAVSQKFKQTLQIFLSQIKITDAMKYKFYSMERTRKRYWLDSPELEHGWNSRKNIVDDHLKVQLLNLKDWNQVFQSEYQFAIEKGKDEVERAAQLSKTYAEFQLAANEGAMFIIDGKLAPLNPTDEKKKHIYIYNKIFFSIANETVYDHSLQKGQDATPSSSSINTDLLNLEQLYKLSIPELHILHMAIIQYRGYKIIAQCIIPGILSIDQMNCSQYGSIDDGKTVEDNEEFGKLMREVCEKMGLVSEIGVVDGSGVRKVIAGSPDIKGILGSDKRKYILDLLRLSPRDLNYEGSENETCVIRPELIRNYRKAKPNDKQKLNVNIGTDIKFEPSENYEAQVSYLKDIAQYLRKTAMDNLVDTLKNYPSQYLTNSEGITRAFHYWGVNMRYLGEVCSHEAVKNEPQIKLVLQRCIFIRSAKHLLRLAMRESNIMHLGATLVNILNCIFGRKSHLLYLEEGMIEEGDAADKGVDKDKKKKKKKNKDIGAGESTADKDPSDVINVIKIVPNKFVGMKPEQVWAELCLIAKARFKYNLGSSQLNFQVFKFPFQKIAALRDVCLSVGLVLQRKNYDIFQQTQGPIPSSPSFSDKTLPFTIRNILNIESSIKRMKIEPTNLLERERQSEQLIAAYQVKEALKIDSMLQRENIAISGGLNQSAIKLFTRMSRILYILGENKSAIFQEEKNICMLQSLHCQDHWLNIQSHINLGLYYIAQGDKNKVVYFMIKGIYLMLIAFGETSPDLLVSFANLARIYHMNKDYKQAIRCYKTAIRFIEQVHGKYHVKMSFCYTSLATISYEMADIRQAIEFQTENVSILSKILPETDTKLQDAQKILKMYREMLHKSEMQSNMASLAKVAETMRKPEEEREHQKKKGKKN